MAKNESTQERHPWRATIRTAVQVLVGLVALVPVLASEVAETFPEAAPWLAVPVAVSGLVARLMAHPAVDAFLTKFVPWLATGGDDPVASRKGDPADGGE